MHVLGGFETYRKCGTPEKNVRNASYLSQLSKIAHRAT